MLFLSTFKFYCANQRYYFFLIESTQNNHCLISSSHFYVLFMCFQVSQQYFLVGLSTLRFRSTLNQGPEAYYRLANSTSWINAFLSDDFC